MTPRSTRRWPPPRLPQPEHSSRAKLLTRLVVASASPRRQALFGLLGQPWRAAPADINEHAFVLADPLVSALNVAAAKAQSVRGAADEVIVAADTLVVAEGEVLGKPADVPAAWRMLVDLRARAHQVLTGVTIRGSNDLRWGGVVATRVVMRDYGDAEVG